MNTRHCAYRQDKRGGRRMEGPAAIESLEPRVLLTATPQDLPVFENFDAGLPTDGWDYLSFRTDGRIEATSGPDKQMRMDVSVDEILNLNTATLHVNLEGLSDVRLRFDQAQHNDEPEMLWDDFWFTHEGDGVAISCDGTRWHTVVNADELNTTGSTLKTFIVDLDQEVAEAQVVFGGIFDYTSSFQIKFQQSGDHAFPGDGRDWDNILIWTNVNLDSVSPTPNTHNALASTDVSATYDQNMKDASATDQTFVVHAMQTGQLLEPPNDISVTGPSVILNPNVNFHPGELVQATATGALESGVGMPVGVPYVWQFRVETTGGVGSFGDRWQDFGLSISNNADVALGDLDGDGDLDAFTANFFVSFPEDEGGSAQPNKVWLNDGGGIFTGGWQQDPSPGPPGEDYPEGSGVRLGDLDADGDLDAFVTNLANVDPNKVWLNDGSGNFSDYGPDLGNAYSQSVSLGDLDGDGDLDAFVANEGPDKVWLNDGSGAFADSAQDLGNAYSQSVSLGDLDGDGDLDAFVASEGPDKIWLNTGSGAFISSGQDFGGTFFSDVALGDLDGDGDLDAFVTYGNLQPNKILLNDAVGTFSETGQDLGSSSSESVCLGDLDGDGDLDAFVGNSYGEPDKIWLNNGLGTFSPSVQGLGTSSTESVSLGDLDGDGDLDAFVATFDLEKEGGVDVVWINGNPTAAPETPDLVAGPTGDTGLYDTDDLTCLDNSDGGKVLQFDVSGTVDGATVTIYAGPTPIGSTTATGTMTTVTTNGSYDLADGEHSITARQTEPGEVESDDSGALMVTVDTVAPTASEPDLAFGSDTGLYNNDDVTQGLTPQFTGTASDADSGLWRVVVNSDDGKSAPDNSGGATYSVELDTLGEGARTVTATASDVAGNTFTTPVLSVTVDRTGPTLDKWSSAATHGALGELLLEIADDGAFTEPRTGGIRMLVLEFSEEVDLSGASVDVVGNNDNDGPPMDLSDITVDLAGRDPIPPDLVFSDTGEISFSSPVPDVGLPDVARYLVHLDGVVADRAGNALTGDRDRIMTSLIGDMKGDHYVVDVRDLYWAWAYKNQSADEGPSQTRADMDLNGTIDVRDLYGAWGKKNHRAAFDDPVLSKGLVAGSWLPLRVNARHPAGEALDAPSWLPLRVNARHPAAAASSSMETVEIPAVAPAAAGGSEDGTVRRRTSSAAGAVAAPGEALLGPDLAAGLTDPLTGESL